MEKKQRLSFDMSTEDHKYLKMCCARLGISIKDFIINATNEAVYAQEDKWFDEIPREDEEGENFIYMEHNGTIHAI
jgi:hypothetical protein